MLISGKRDFIDTGKLQSVRAKGNSVCLYVLLELETTVEECVIVCATSFKPSR